MRWYSFIKHLAAAGSRRSLQDPFLTRPGSSESRRTSRESIPNETLRLCVELLGPSASSD
jgi:hypothetical protein